MNNAGEESRRQDQTADKNEVSYIPPGGHLFVRNLIASKRYPINSTDAALLAELCQ
jgi:hypothetical protein